MRRVVRVIKPQHVDKVVHHTRAMMMHTSAFGFSNDFIQVVFGEHMAFHHVWEVIREPVVSWSALAAALIVYIDTCREDRRHEAHIPQAWEGDAG